MSTVNWDDSLSIGIPMIDKQHQAWISHLNRLEAALAEHEGQAGVVTALNFLVDYTRMHFATEEECMDANDYPGFTEHQGRHTELRESLNELVREFEEEGATYGIAQALHDLLANWLRAHILKVDIKFGKFLHENGLSLDK